MAAPRPAAKPTAQPQPSARAGTAARKPDSRVSARRSRAAQPPGATDTGVHYTVRCADLNAHLFAVSVRIDRPTGRQRVSLPAWIPGSYLLREFARNLQHLRASQGRRRPALRQLDKATWEIDCEPGQPLELHYEVNAFDASVRTAWLDAQRGFFNGTSLCLRVEDQADAPCTLTIEAPAHSAQRWSCATALRPLRVDRHGFGRYGAADYDEIADSPVELGAFWSAEFDVLGVPHRFVVAGATAGFDGDRLIADTRAICETQLRFWHGEHAGARARSAAHRPPHDRYVFLLNAVGDGYGGLEHRHSTALICTRADLPQHGQAKATEGYTTLLGLISHEYFHTWNVKRLRPAELARYDYAQENYTQLLWFFEGFTSYYDDLLLRRAGCIDDATYVKLLNKTANQVLQAPGRRVQSVAEASFDAWVKFYRPDAQTPNLTISYYTKGALVALCLDLRLRSEGPGSLDAVMRLLWTRSGGGPIDEAAVAQALADVGGRSYAPELAQWVHGTADLPLKALLNAHGVASLDEPAQRAQALGLRVDEGSSGVRVKVVLRDSAAEKAGFAPGDEWLGVELPATRGRQAEGWRLNKLDDLALYLGEARKCQALVARDRQLLRLPLQLPMNERTLRLAPQDAPLLAAWLLNRGR